MDRSFLSQPEVISASRPFVCVRLATYEDPLEAKLLKGLASTRSGELENSVFCILSPDGKNKLVRGARSMKQVYSDSKAMADGLKRVIEKYEPKASQASLPLVTNAKLALDIAAADGQPLVVIVGKDEAARLRLAKTVAPLAWNDDFIGRFVYVTATTKELTAIEGLKVDSGVVVVRPDKYGLKGNVLAQIDGGAEASKIGATLRKALAEFEPIAKSFRTHVREGHRDGIYWEPPLPVTDPEERAARERGRNGLSPKGK